MHSNESSENYLETILILSKRLPVVRSVDIATELSYSKPSVSIAMKNLRTARLIDVSSSGYITLTPGGRKIATQIYERHTVLSQWLMSLGVKKSTALDDACKIEHHISNESFQALKKHIKNA